MLWEAPISILSTFLILIHHSPLTYSTPTHFKLYEVSEFSDQLPRSETQAEFITRSVLECSVLACTGLKSKCRFVYNFTSMSCNVNPRKPTRCKELKRNDIGDAIFCATSEKPTVKCGVSHQQLCCMCCSVNWAVSCSRKCELWYSNICGMSCVCILSNVG